MRAVPRKFQAVSASLASLPEAQGLIGQDPRKQHPAYEHFNGLLHCIGHHTMQCEAAGICDECEILTLMK